MQEAWDDVDDTLILAIISAAALAWVYRDLARERPRSRVNFAAAADRYSGRVKALADQICERDRAISTQPRPTAP